MKVRILCSFTLAVTLVLVTGLPGTLGAQGDREAILGAKIHIGGVDPEFRGQNNPMLPPGEGPYHNGDLLVCTDCHVMHAEMQHNYQGGYGPEGGVDAFPWSTEPAPYLLKAPDPVDLCLMCHDGTAGIPDVVGADVNGLVQRAGGHFDLPDVETNYGHDLGRGLGQGFYLCMRCHFGGDDADVTCIDCHDPHGNGNPRSLQWASDPGATPALGLLVDPNAGDLDRYERSNVAYGTLNSESLREVSNICIDCHHVFSGGTYIDPDGDGIHSRHPTYDSERSSPNNIQQGETRGSTNPQHWEDGTGSGFDGTERVRFVVDGASTFSDAMVVDASTNGVFCLSCHYAHGSDEPFGLTWPVQDMIDYVGCDQCHYLARVDNPVRNVSEGGRRSGVR